MLHTTGTTSPEGVHQLAPNLGERRPMEPPSGGHFKMPAGYGPQVQAQEAQAALPGHKVELAGSTSPMPAGQPFVAQGVQALGFSQPPAPSGYQSAPTHVPPGMVAQTVVHEHTPQLVAPYHQPQHTTGTPTYTGHAPYGLGQPVGWPQQLGPYEVAPTPQRTVLQPAAAPLPVQPQAMPWPAAPMPAQGVTVQLEGDSQALEAAIGMLMLRGVRVAVVG